MEPPYQRPNILRLPEVTIGDYIGLEDFVDNQRLLAAGKAPKLALMACMRRLLVILNTMMNTGRHWEVPTPSTP
jgi:hypothetical protein